MAESCSKSETVCSTTKAENKAVAETKNGNDKQNSNAYTKFFLDRFNRRD